MRRAKCLIVFFPSDSVVLLLVDVLNTYFMNPKMKDAKYVNHVQLLCY